MSSTKESNSTTKKVQKEIITPHKLTVAILIRNFCQFRDLDEFKSIEDEALKCKYRRDFSVLTFKLIQSPDLSLQELRSLLSLAKFNIPKTVIESFAQTMTTLNSEGTGNMLDIIDSLSRVMSFNESATPDSSKCLITKNSIIGYYLRRLIVNFDKLTFSEVTSVFLAFQRYYAEWMKSFNRSPVSVNTIPTRSLVDWSANRDQWSKRQAELLIATQAELLTNDEERALSPPELQKRISTLLKSNPNISEAHFLSYLNYMRIKEFCGALNSLYHCFDKSSYIENKTFDEKNKCYRFGALNLSILHFHFGHYENALAALKEAIKISQEAHDNICLQHALSWLSRLTTINKDNLIVHCVSKSAELNLTYNKSLGLQTLGEYGCSTSGNPYTTFETLNKSDIINCQHNHADLMSNSYALKSSLWQFYGKTEMSSLWSQLLLYLNIDCISPSTAYYGEGFCLSICNMATHLLFDGDYNLVNTILVFIKTCYPKEPNAFSWMLVENLFIFIRSMHHENWPEAESAAQKIMVIDKCEGLLRLAELHLYKKDYNEANHCIEIFLSDYENEDNRIKSHFYVRAKILLAEVQFSSSYPENVPAGILTVLNNCLIETNRSKLDYYTAIIHMHIANVLLSLGLTGQALKVLDRCLIQILAHGGACDRAKVTLLFVKCLVADSHKLEDVERMIVITGAVKLLNKVKKNFEEVEAFSRMKDVLYLQAQLYNCIGKTTERNKCALQFKLLDQDQATKNVTTLYKFV